MVCLKCGEDTPLTCHEIIEQDDNGGVKCSHCGALHRTTEYEEIDDICIWGFELVNNITEVSK